MYHNVMYYRSKVNHSQADKVIPFFVHIKIVQYSFTLCNSIIIVIDSV
jgi:hypothetical protein